MSQKVSVRVSLNKKKDATRVLKEIAQFPGVFSISFDRETDRFTLIGDGVDILLLVRKLRKSFGSAELISVKPCDIADKSKADNMQADEDVTEFTSVTDVAYPFMPWGMQSPDEGFITRFKKVMAEKKHNDPTLLIEAKSAGHFPSLNTYRKATQLHGLLGSLASGTTTSTRDGEALPESTQAPELTASGYQVNKLTIFGREDDEKTLLEFLTSDVCRERNVTVIRMVGPAGVGKSVFTRLLYNNSTVCEVFGTRAWVCGNDRLDIRGLMKEMVESLTGISCNFTELGGFHEAIIEELIGKKFLLVLDNVNKDDMSFWNSLILPLSVGAKGSIVMATSRNEMEALNLENLISYKLNKLSLSICYKIFDEVAFGGGTPCIHPELEELGMQIVIKCEGLPLAVKAIGGVLQSVYNENYWKIVLKSAWWFASGNNLPPALRLSYFHLPEYLRQCFQFCSLFPKGYAFEKDRLVRLWMSQHLISNEDIRDVLMDMSTNYFNELVKRTFFQSCPNSDPREEKYVMHDAYYDLVQSKSTLGFFRAEACKLYDMPEGVRHASLVPYDFDVALEFEPVKDFINIRTLLLVNRSVMKWDARTFHLGNAALLNDLFFHLKSLRTLDLSFTNIQVVPESIANLQQLSYRALNKTNIRMLPESICNLNSLQTLELQGCAYLSELPGGIKYLGNLQHLDVRKEFGFVPMPSGIGQLTSLQNLPAFMVGIEEWQCKIRELKHLIKLRGSLCIGGLGNVISGKEAKEARLEWMKCITTLVMDWCEGEVESVQTVEIAYQVLQNLQPHSNLEELTIRDYFGDQFPEWITDLSFSKLIALTLDNCCGCDALPQLGQLPSLRHLSIRMMDRVKHVDRRFLGSGTLRGFRSLETLKLWEMSELKDWSGVEDTDFPCLRSLSISKCNKLRRLPCFTSLLELSVHCCAHMPELPTLPSLMSLTIEGLQKLESLPQQLDLPLLKVLEISNCNQLKALGGLAHFASVGQLRVTRCPNLVT